MDNQILAFNIYRFHHLDNLISGYFDTILRLTFHGRRPAIMDRHQRYRLRELHMSLCLIWGWISAANHIETWHAGKKHPVQFRCKFLPWKLRS